VYSQAQEGLLNRAGWSNLGVDVGVTP
jgi:hypothetical protein